MTDLVIGIQARLTSTRLPRKAVMPLGGVPMVVFLHRRLLRFGFNENQIFYLVPNNDENDELRYVLSAHNINYITSRSVEADVLARYQLLAEKVGCKKIVRLTADNPLIFPEIIIEAKKKLEAGADLVSTREIDMTTRKIRHYFPKGQSVDAFDSSLLIPGDDMVEYEKEHVLPYLLRKAKNFKIQTPDFGKFIGNIDLLDNYSVDTLDDYKNAKLLVED